MTKDEALDLAQKALEDACGNRCNAEYNPCFQREAINAIKAAKEAKDESVVIYGYCPICGGKGTSRERHPDGNTHCVNRHTYKSRDALITPPQQEAKDEPKAWMHPSGEGYDSAFRDHRTVMACTGNKWEGWVPLYTNPPQRKPLTDEEIWACLPKDPDEMAFARAIEAAHGIKGEAK